MASPEFLATPRRSGKIVGTAGHRGAASDGRRQFSTVRDVWSLWITSAGISST